eukprot:scaffold1401_cov330-Pavlova_lutheri.AAC.89
MSILVILVTVCSCGVAHPKALGVDSTMFVHGSCKGRPMWRRPVTTSRSFPGNTLVSFGPGMHFLLSRFLFSFIPSDNRSHIGIEPFMFVFLFHPPVSPPKAVPGSFDSCVPPPRGRKEAHFRSNPCPFRSALEIAFPSVSG